MNITLNQETKPYEETRNRINILVSTFNKFILSNHQPSESETDEIYKQWRALETKHQIGSPKTKQVTDSPAKRQIQAHNNKVLQAKAK